MHLFFNFTYDTDFQLFLPHAFVAEQRNQSWYLLKKATDEVLKNSPLDLSSKEKEALVLTHSLDPLLLLEKYTDKKHSLSERYKDKAKKKYIQQQIEEKVNTLLSLIAQHGLWLVVNCQKEHPLERQLLTLSDKVFQPLLEFEKTPTGIAYRLFLLDKEKLIPSEHTITLLSQEGSWIVMDHTLVQVAPIKALNLKPFLDKTTVVIPESTIPEYFNKFLKEIIKKVDISTIGFDIIQKHHLVATHIKWVHDFLTNTYKLFLSFDYDGVIFHSNQSRSQQSHLEVLPNGDIQIEHYKRNPSEEAERIQQLEAVGFVQEDGNFFIKDSYPFASYFHLLKHIQTLEAQGFILSDLEVNNQKINREPYSLSFGETTETNDWFDIRMTITQGAHQIYFSELVKNLREQNPLYPLPDGTLFVIPKEWFAKYDKISKFGRVVHQKIQLPKSNYTLLEDLPELKPQKPKTEIHYTPSPNLKAQLRPYQTEGVKWLLQHHYNGLGACLADDMGLGKTLQTLALLVHIHDSLPEKENPFPTSIFDLGKSQKEALKCLIIMPSSLLFNWYEEIKRFAPELSCTQYVGHDRKAKALRLSNYDIVLSSYPIVLKDAKLLERYTFRYIILDESQRIKNNNSQIFKTISALKAEHKISLSGTPIENSLSDLWAQMQFINPNILGSYSQFNKYFRTEIEKKHNPIALEELKGIISPFLLRRTKQQVLKDLPDIEEQIAYCPMSEAQEKWYEQEKSKVRNQLLHIDTETDPAAFKLNAINMLTKLRQISNHPKLIDPQSEIPSGKYEEVISHLEQLWRAGQKTLIFSSFTSHLALYEDWCKKEKIKHVSLTGATPLEARKIAVERFQNDKEVSFFFISLKAGEVGLNLTAASYVLLLDPWWNPFTERQAIGRAHRLGQENKVNVIRFVSRNTLEEKIIRLQQSKKELSEHLIEEDTLKNEALEHLEELLE